MLDRLEFIISEAFVALRRNTLMSLAAVTTVAVSLFILAGLGYTYLRLSEVLQSLPARLDSRVYFVRGVSMEQVKQTLAGIREMPEVDKAVWIPAETAWKKFKQQDPHPMWDDLKRIPYPEALKITWKDLSKVSAAAARIRQMPLVRKVDQPEDAQKIVSQSMGLVRRIGIGLGGILLLTGGILIFNAIRLTILSRRREIRIMQLVGASRAMIQTPFVIEGVIQGILGGVLAHLILIATKTALMNVIQQSNLPITLPDPDWQVLGLLCAAGAVYGLVCSLMAVREPTRFR
jgi:cell division transport system permease protein